jgi:hypothetical protein
MRRDAVPRGLVEPVTVLADSRLGGGTGRSSAVSQPGPAPGISSDVSARLRWPPARLRMDFPGPVRRRPHPDSKDDGRSRQLAPATHAGCGADAEGYGLVCPAFRWPTDARQVRVRSIDGQSGDWPGTHGIP